MPIYENLSGESGVAAYELRTGAIVVQFQDGSRYEYTNASAGARNVAEMHQLAKAGLGLSTFISRHVSDRFARSWR